MVTELLRIEGLAHQYPRSTQRALTDVLFDGHSGEVIFVLGPNGSGKTTLFKLLMRLLPLQQGTMLVNGHDVRTLSPKDLAKHVAYVPQQHEASFNFPVRSIVLMGRTAHLPTWASTPTADDEQVANELIDSLGITALADRGLRDLSGGERQLVFTARALAQGGRIMVMDEPTANLDFANQERVMRHIRGLANQGYLVLVSSHHPSHALVHADRILLLKDGRTLGCPTPSELTDATLENLYGTPVRLVESPDAPGVRFCVPTHAERKSA